MPFSEKTSDWGAFGSYISIGISVLSVTLIYITYNEQRHSNEVERYEQHVKSMTDILFELVEKNSSTLNEHYQSILIHFKIPFFDISHYDKLKSEKVCSYYFSNIVSSDDCDCLHLFKYMLLLINVVKKNGSLKTEDKEGRIIELSCIVPVSFRTLYFFWLTYIKDYTLLEYCYQNRLFCLDNDDDSVLGEVIKLVCTGNKNKKSSSVTIYSYNIEIEDYSKETFDETYKRLFNDK